MFIEGNGRPLGTHRTQVLDPLGGTPLLPFRTYTLRVEVGNIASGQALSGEFFDLSGFPGYRIDLLAGGTSIASDPSTLSASIPEGEFATSVVTFSAMPGDLRLGLDLGIRLVNLNQVDPLAPAADLEVDFDDVRLRFTPSLDGDFNFDGAVDAADYTVWRDTLGSGAMLAADANQNGVVDIEDYLVWADNYGAPITAGGVGPDPVAVPEPAAAWLVMLVVWVGFARRRTQFGKQVSHFGRRRKSLRRFYADPAAAVRISEIGAAYFSAPFINLIPTRQETTCSIRGRPAGAPSLVWIARPQADRTFMRAQAPLDFVDIGPVDIPQGVANGSQQPTAAVHGFECRLVRVLFSALQ